MGKKQAKEKPEKEIKSSRLKRLKRFIFRKKDKGLSEESLASPNKNKKEQTGAAILKQNREADTSSIARKEPSGQKRNAHTLTSALEAKSQLSEKQEPLDGLSSGKPKPKPRVQQESMLSTLAEPPIPTPRKAKPIPKPRTIFDPKIIDSTYPKGNEQKTAYNQVISQLKSINQNLNSENSQSIQSKHASKAHRQSLEEITSKYSQQTREAVPKKTQKELSSHGKQQR